ncbi:putative tyrosinase-like protein tyr-3 [Smittium mucronatum]|uniref:Putative tyrosinase-like protein tyr-3 n=1 Tax=Smittium mucronatum TaxID=133383 RepID=A0A1R0H363_9FUNG|nr:putative tyrosinase-like protein tyr-3 [Smittium mucronatum]
MKLMGVKSLLKLVASSFYLISAQDNLPRCSQITIRKEIRTLSTQEWGNIKNVLGYLQNDGTFARLAQEHTTLFGVVHGGPIFLPFHRRLVLDIEEAGKRYSPDFFVPYWDATRDYQSPEKSIVFSPDYMGGNGDPSNDNCITNGPEYGWNMSYPRPHCLRRVFNGQNGTVKSWYSPETMTSTLQTSTSLDNFRSNLEFTLHGAVHLGVGGDMITPEAPNDFIFFLHHSNMDRLWWKWQNAKESNLMDYGGKNPQKTNPASLDDLIDGYTDRVRDVMKIGYGRVCSLYDDVLPLPSLNFNTTLFRNLRSLDTGNLIVGNNNTASGDNDSNSPSSDTQDGEKTLKDLSFNTGLRTLSSQTLEKFFPELKSSKINVNMFETSGAKLGLVLGSEFSSNNTKSVKKRAYMHVMDNKRDCGGSNTNYSYNGGYQDNAKTLPVPYMPPDSYIKMHNYKKSDVEFAVNKCIDLVNTLNREGYVSPF